MRIALIYHQFILRGGLEGYLLEFAKQLCGAGHELHLVTSDVAEKLAQHLGATIHRVPVMKGSALMGMWQFERAASRIARELEVHVTIGFGRTTTHDLHRAGGGCHAVYSELLPPWKRWGPKNRLELQLERDLYTSGRTKRFVVNSSEVAKQLHAAYGTDNELLRVIHTAVDTERFRPSDCRSEVRAKICEQLQSDPKRPAFLFVSLSHRRKGIETLLDAWEGVDADLWIVGKELHFLQRRKVLKKGLKEKLRVIQPSSNIALMYQAADWFIHPTLYDACANTVLQSMACGLPGLISVNDGAIDFVRDGINSYLLGQPTDAEAVRSVIKKALSLPEQQRLNMGSAARETMLPLTWQSHIKKWLELIGEVCDHQVSIS
jgi:UDP-glucose:(heptosyl)LPS alpha-1,3-glucosyltransferase